MCGIAGVFHFDDAPVSREEVGVMLEALRHRGPDGTGCHVEGRFGLGMTRLAIIDVAGGWQPIFNEDRSAAIVCNGEIYNHKEIRQRLVSRGHRFDTLSDVEVVLHLYEEEGTSCFAQLNGMFSVAIADFRRQRLVLARDPFGQKPLYLWRRHNRIAFASELKALTALPGFSRTLCASALANYLQFRYVPAPLTIYEGVEKLTPGTQCSVGATGTVESKRYWRINFGAGRERSRPGELRDRLAEATERHLMSERPLGVFLSGGLDSSAIVACMHDAGHKDIRTYTVGFEGYEDNEFGTARVVAQKFRTVHTEVMLTAAEFWESLNTVTQAADEPLADMTTVPLYHLCRRAREDVVVVLSGEGADELLGGYPGVEDMRKVSDRIRAMRPFLPITSQLRHLPWPDGVQRRLRALAEPEANYLARRPYSITNVFDTEFRVRNGVNGITHLPDPLSQVSEYYQSRQDWNAVDLSLGALIEWWLPDDLLHKADRMSMAQSIEVRCPFLDTDFAAYCADLALDDKVRARRKEPSRKIALKNAFADSLSKEIVFQRKKGFTLPVFDWLGSVFAEPAKAELTRASGLSASLFPTAVREEMLSGAARGDRLSQYRVWSLVILNKWAEQGL